VQAAKFHNTHPLKDYIGESAFSLLTLTSLKASREISRRIGAARARPMVYPVLKARFGGHWLSKSIGHASPQVKRSWYRLAIPCPKREPPKSTLYHDRAAGMVDRPAWHR
jgi:hypothetical protein